MAVTPNNTLPNQWNSTITYHEGDTVMFLNVIYRCLQTSLNNIPALSGEYWKALDIYIKDYTVMPHGDYSGDENFWQRDQLYIDASGYVYVNNENTGINVKGPASAAVVSFEDLTPAQIEQLRGPQGIQGPQGETGPQGIQGPQGEVTLTPEQIEELKGEQGKSAYDIWIEAGHVGTIDDFLNWLRSGIITLDPALDINSENGVQNKVIATAFADYKRVVNETLLQFSQRIQDLENRLQYEFNNKTHYFKFGITSNGKYGYILTDSDTVIPFDNVDANNLLTSNSVVPSLLTASENFGLSSNSPVTETIGDIGVIEPTSLHGVVSNSTGIDTKPIYANNVELMSLEEGLNITYNVFNNGLFEDNYTFSLYGMTYDINQTSDLESEGTHNVEGILFDTTSISTQAGRIYFEVEPINENEVINYRIGTFTNPSAELPNIVTEGSATYNDGSFNSHTTINIEVPPNQGVYFASTEGGEYRITRIYLM